MEKLREMVIKMATAEQQKSLSSSQIAKIEQQLQTAFPSGLHTPNHPPYAAMIYKAITMLNEEGGSSEELISAYIQEEYNDLPFAHNSFLRQHLRKLCAKGFVVFSADRRYMIRNFTATSVDKEARTNEMVCLSPPPEDNCCQNQEFEGNNSRKRNNRPRRQLVFNKQDEHDKLCKSVKTKLSLIKEVKSVDSKGKTKSRRVTTETAKKKLMLSESGGGIVDSKGESSKDMVKRKKKDKKKWMITALSDDIPNEETPIEQDTENQMIEYNERKDPSCLLESLVQTTFFEECKVHLDADSSNKCNSYCMDCMNGALCDSCRSSHKDHNLFKVSQSMWELVVLVSQIQRYIDTSEIQDHLINSRPYVSLKRTVSSRHRKHFTGLCFICKRHLPETFKFCSLHCKFMHDLASSSPSPTN